MKPLIENKLQNGASALYFVTIAFASGVLFRSFYEVGLAEISFVVLIALVLVFCGRGFGHAPNNPTPRSIRRRKKINLLCNISVLNITLVPSFFTIEYFESRLNQEVAFTGVIAREPDERAVMTHLYVETDYGLVLVTTPRGEDWRYGDRVEVVGEIEKPEEFETDLGRTFNYRGYLLAKGVGYMTSFAEVERVSVNEGSAALSFIFKAKGIFIEKIESLIPEPEAGLSLGLLLGVKRALGEDLETDFRRTGIIHIVVLSGYNVMIVVTFILYVLGRLFGTKLSALFGIMGIIAFAVLVGFGATVIRASIMACLLLIMGLTGRVYLVLRGLFVAAALMIIWNPYSLAFDVGFQLSFLATLGLIVFSPYLQQKLEVLPEKIGVREFVTATLATQLFVLPLLLYQIGEFSVVAVVVNVLVLPMVAVAMLLSFLTGVSAFVLPPLADLLAFLSYLSLTYIVHIAEWFSDLPLAAFTVPLFPFWFVPLGYGLIGLLIWWLNRKPDPLSGWTIVEKK